MQSKEVLVVIAMAQEAQCRPSEVIGGLDDYTAYCFDSACLLIKKHLQGGDKPHWREKVQKAAENYSSFGALIKSLQAKHKFKNGGRGDEH